MERIPAVDLLEGRVVRLFKGRFDRVTVFGDDPAAAARRFVEFGARTVHLVFLDGARKGLPPDPAVVESIAQTGALVEAAGGIRDAASARRTLDAGAERVVVGSAAEDPERLRSILDATGPDRLAVALDVAGQTLRVRGWEAASRWGLDARLDALEGEGVRRIFFTAVDRDGTLEGPDTEAVEALVRRPFHLTVAGGIASMEHIRALETLGADAAVLGRALYDGTLPLESLRAS